MTDAFLKRRDLILSLLGNIPGFEVNLPEGAFYVFPKIDSFFGKTYERGTIGNAEDFALFLLESAHVAVVSGDAFGAPECIRISYASSEEEIKLACERIMTACSHLR